MTIALMREIVLQYQESTVVLFSSKHIKQLKMLKHLFIHFGKVNYGYQ